MRFPRTKLAYALFPLWLLKRALLEKRRARVLRSGTDRWFDEVDPSLVVGGALFAGDLEALRAKGVGAILSLCAEYLDDEAACAACGVLAHRIAVHDDFRPSEAHFEAAVAWIDEQVAAGKKVYVHCAAGRGRSVSVAAAWLALRHAISFDEALARIQAVRPAAHPARWQRAAGRRFVEGRRLRAKGSRG